MKNIICPPLLFKNLISNNSFNCAAGHFCLLLLVFFSAGILQKAYGQSDGLDCSPSAESNNTGCSANVCFANYPTTEAAFSRLPIIYIRVKFYFIVPDVNTQNFHCDPNGQADLYAPNVAAALLSAANDAFENPEANLISPSPQIPDVRMRYVLAEDPGDDCPGVKLITGNAPPSNSFPGDHLPILVRDNGNACVNGSGPITHIEINNVHKKLIQGLCAAPIERWGYLINHEFGHVMGLCHAFSASNNCPDVDPAAECGGPSGTTCEINNVVTPCGPLHASGAHPGACGFGDCFSCYCTWGVSNNIMGYNGSMKGITRYQWAHLYGNAYASQAGYLQKPCVPPAPGQAIVVTQDETWDYTQYINSPVEVLSPATLTITCNTYMGEDQKIIVHRGARLVVSGCTISSICPDERWGGIYVHGNTTMEHPADPWLPLNPNGPGIVITQDFARIEHAAVAISTQAPGYSWQEQQARWGGMIHARNTTFANNRKAVEFYPYARPNKSAFFTCIFEEEEEYDPNTEGVTVWGCHNILFNNCTFRNFDKDGIYGIDYAARVLNLCVFEHNRSGIRALSTSTLPYLFQIGDEDATISGFANERNVFQNDSTDIHITASYTLPGRLRVIRNDFSGVNTAISRAVFVNTYCDFEIRHNNFDDYNLGIWINNTGSYQNKVTCNIFDNNRYGITVYRDNNRTEFLENEFYNLPAAGSGTINSPAEIRLIRTSPIAAKAIIRNTQGTEGDPADNCFDVANGIDIRANAADAEFFTYYHLENQPAGSCKVPVVGNNNYELKETDDRNYDPCFPDAASSLAGEPPYTFSQLQSLRTLRAGRLADWQNEPENLQKAALYYEAADATDDVLYWLVNDWLAQGNVQMADSAMALSTHPQELRSLIGMKAARGDLAGFAAALATYPVSNEEDSLFVAVQQINLQRLSASSAPFALDASQETFLYQVAYREEGVRAYARGLLALLKGAQFPDDPEYGLWSEPEERSSTEATAQYLFFPNPANQLLHVQYPAALTGLRLLAFDFHGRLQLDMPLGTTGHEQIPLGRLADGVYHFRLLSGATVLHARTIAIIK